MAASKDFKDFVLEQLSLLKNIKYKPMMGEFLLYCNDILFGGIYDNRLLIKITTSNKIFGLASALPYKNAKPMFVVENLDDKQNLCNIITTTCNDLLNN